MLPTSFFWQRQDYPKPFAILEIGDIVSFNGWFYKIVGLKKKKLDRKALSRAKMRKRSLMK